MFKNAGIFIKFLATAMFVVNIILAIIASVCLGIRISEFTVMPVCIAAGILVFGLCVCVSYVECALIYGYGDLIDNTKEIRRMLTKYIRNYRDNID